MHPTIEEQLPTSTKPFSMSLSPAIVMTSACSTSLVLVELANILCKTTFVEVLGLMRFFTRLSRIVILRPRIEEGCFAHTCFDFFQIKFGDVGENGQIRLEGNMCPCVVFIAGSDFFSSLQLECPFHTAGSIRFHHGEWSSPSTQKQH